MSSYAHLRRYGKKPGASEVATVDVIGDGQVVYKGHRYDLRTGEKGAKQSGFCHHLDGRYLDWNGDVLEVKHADGRSVPLQIDGGKHVAIVGNHVVYNDDSRQPWLVIDTFTGEQVGRVEDMRGDATYGTVLYSPQWFDPKNDRTVWLCEGSRLAELDVAQRRMARTIEAQAEHTFVAVAAVPDGHVITLARSLEDKATHNRGGDRIVLFSPTGERLRDVPGEVMFISRIGDFFLVSDDRKEQFVVYDTSLEPVARVEMFDPGRDAYNAIVPLPSGREWIGIGARGEWDHYGDPALAPTGKAKKAPARAKAKKKAATVSDDGSGDVEP
jgi:hypothetical protein